MRVKASFPLTSVLESPAAGVKTAQNPKGFVSFNSYKLRR